MGLTMRNINKIMTIASFVVGVPGVFASAANDSTYNLAAIIYDTDASLHGAFTCSPYWSVTIDGSEAVNYKQSFLLQQMAKRLFHVLESLKVW